MAKSSNHSPLEQALEYYALGWCIIPIPSGSKKARVKWGQYQENRPAEKQLKKWFTRGPRNVAVVLGDASGGLTGRDFDDVAEYDLWSAKHPKLARQLPTVGTARGRHVYFIGHHPKITKISGGELRGTGGYCVLPPSIHPDGPCYQWLNPPTKANLLTLSPQEAGFVESTTDDTDETYEAEETDEAEKMMQCRVVGVEFVDLEPHEQAIEEAIQDTYPREIKTSNGVIFQFARALKAIAALKNADVNCLEPCVERWHRLALPVLREKDFFATWMEFVYGWDRVKVPKGEGVMERILANARAEPVQDPLLKTDNMKLLAAICRELQQLHGKQPFWLSTPMLETIFSVDRKTAWLWMDYLRRFGWLEKVECGNRIRANRYRYIGGPQNKR